VAVIWGEAQGVTYASYGKPLRRFLSRVLGRRTSVVYSCPGGACPQRPKRPTLPGRAGLPTVDSRWNGFQQQLDELHAQKQDRGDYLTRGELPDFGGYARHEDFERLEDETDSRHATLLERLQSLGGRTVGKAAGTAAVGLLGLSGPAGWAVIAGSSIGGWLVGRRMKRKLRGAGGRRRRRFQGEGGRLKTEERQQELATPTEGSAANAEAMFRPVERDLDEARQLLRLSRLEGRDPLQDAAAGRLAIDRLDAIADSDRDSQRAKFADELRRELRERFNEIAPTSL